MVDPFSSQDPSSYTIQPIGGGAAVDILNVVLMNGTNVYITTRLCSLASYTQLALTTFLMFQAANTLNNYNRIYLQPNS
jgi:hypothetical protein